MGGCNLVAKIYSLWGLVFQGKCNKVAKIVANLFVYVVVLIYLCVIKAAKVNDLVQFVVDAVANQTSATGLKALKTPDKL